MIWQDLVFGLGSVVFTIALIPSVVLKQPPSLATSIPTAIVLAIFAGTYITLAYYFAAVVTVLSALLWATLAFQKAFVVQ